MGVGELAVPRELRRIAEAFYGRRAAYQAALAVDDDDALVDALARNVFAGGEMASASRLALHVRQAARQLAGQDCAAFTRSELNFPEADAVQALAPAANR